MSAAAKPDGLAFGNSQIAAFVAGARRLRQQGEPVPSLHSLVFRGARYEPFAVLGALGARLHPAIAGDLAAALREADPAFLVAAIMGADHWILGIANDPVPFDFLVPELPGFGLAPGARLIPYDLICRRFRQDMGLRFGLLRLARTLSDRPIYVIEAPPPVASTARMQEWLYGPFAARVARHGMAPAGFRFKIWWVCHRITATLAAELGAHFVEAPAETRDADGFLDPRFFLDGVHGNDAYGALMVRQVAAARRLVEGV
ncbi:MAG: hypothetical protein KGL12_10190 [Rhodospirillales bacterium]|nr:hypothetical protein [Rhodospirillales bacterium]